MGEKVKSFAYSVGWNVFLITLGAFLVALSIKAVILPHQLISGGTSGAALVCYYILGWLTPGQWNFILNVPIFILGWFYIGRRFLFYSLYGMVMTSAFLEVINVTFPIHDTILAVVAAGVVLGSGVGIALRSLGSTGGTDIIGVILNKKFNLRVGQVSFGFNAIVFFISLLYMEVDRVLYSLLLVFIMGQVMEYFMSMFNQRNMVLIISDRADQIARRILEEMHRGSTFLSGKGAYTGNDKKIILTVINNFQTKRLEELVFTTDPQAFTIFDNTMNVMGKGFSTRKAY